MYYREEERNRPCAVHPIAYVRAHILFGDAREPRSLTWETCHYCDWSSRPTFTGQPVAKLPSYDTEQDLISYS